MRKIQRAPEVDRRFDVMREQIELAREKAKTYQGPCSTCRWCSVGFLDDSCIHPVVDAVAFNLTDAYDKQMVIKCSEQRDKKSIYGPVVCGPEGLLHEEKLTWLQRLLGARYHDGT